jgi:hypothetical protein
MTAAGAAGPRSFGPLPSSLAQFEAERMMQQLLKWAEQRDEALVPLGKHIGCGRRQ